MNPTQKDALKTCLEQLREALLRLELINGPKDQCICGEMENCPNHQLMNELKQLIKRQEENSL